MKKFLLILLLLVSCKKENIVLTSTSTVQISETLNILSFNIQIFGVSKMSKNHVVDILVDIVQKYDLIAIQEVRDSSNTAVIDFMSLLPDRFNYTLGPREGRTSSKEQYWYIYDENKLEILAVAVYPDPDDVFERDPMGVHFSCIDDVFDFVVINNHISPRDAYKEINYFPNVVRWFEKIFQETDIIILGDLNADGTYFNENLLQNIFPEEEYLIVIDNSLDTTVAISDNTYDRIIITKSLFEDFEGSYGVFRFDEHYDFSEIQPKEVSDHYPVWAIFYTDRDTD